MRPCWPIRKRSQDLNEEGRCPALPTRHCSLRAVLLLLAGTAAPGPALPPAMHTDDHACAHSHDLLRSLSPSVTHSHASTDSHSHVLTHTVTHSPHIHCNHISTLMPLSHTDTSSLTQPLPLIHSCVFTLLHGQSPHAAPQSHSLYAIHILTSHSQSQIFRIFTLSLIHSPTHSLFTLFSSKSLPLWELQPFGVRVQRRPL